MAEWVRLCGAEDAPEEGNVMEAEAKGVTVCVARIAGKLAALDNWCPHRRGPLGQGWVEGESVVCPWHSWAFDVHSGDVLPPDRGHVAVFPVKIEGADVLIDLG